MGAIWEQEEGGLFQRSGYCFQLYLPRGKGEWIPATLSRICDEDADAAEKRFLWLAWPTSYGNSAKRCFLIDQNRTVKTAANDEWKFSGKSKAPTPDLASHSEFRPVH